MGRQVDRLAAHLRSSPDAERPLAGQIGGGLWLIAAVATFVLPFFPQVDTPLWPWPALWTLGAVAWGVCAIFVIDWRRAPGWVLPAAAAAAVVVIAAITLVTGGTDSPARLYVFFALVYAGCFIAAAPRARADRRLRAVLGAARSSATAASPRRSASWRWRCRSSPSSAAC